MSGVFHVGGRPLRAQLSDEEPEAADFLFSMYFCLYCTSHHPSRLQLFYFIRYSFPFCHRITLAGLAININILQSS